MAAPRDEYKEKEESETFCRRLCILFLCSYDEVPRVFRSSTASRLRFENFLLSEKYNN